MSNSWEDMQFAKWTRDGAVLSDKILTSAWDVISKPCKILKMYSYIHLSSHFFTSAFALIVPYCICCKCVWGLRESEWGEKVSRWFMQMYAQKLLQTIWCCVPAKEHEEHESGRAERVGVCVCPDICAYHLFMLCVHIWWLSKRMCCFTSLN